MLMLSFTSKGEFVRYVPNVKIRNLLRKYVCTTLVHMDVQYIIDDERLTFIDLSSRTLTIIHPDTHYRQS